MDAIAGPAQEHVAGRLHQPLAHHHHPLPGCDTEALDDTRARATGALAACSATDIVNACVVEGALRRHDLIISSDPGDLLQAIAAASSRHLEIDHP